MSSVLTLTAFLLREEGGGLIREEGLIKKFNLQTRGLLERGGLIRAFTACSKRGVHLTYKVKVHFHY